MSNTKKETMDKDKIEQLIERKVEETVERKMEEKTPEMETKSSYLDDLVDQKVQEKFREQEKGFLQEVGEKEVSRRGFLKTLGLGAGGLALASSVAGGSLLSGTTIGGNTAWHAGNDGPNSGLHADDADTVDDKEPPFGSDAPIYGDGNSGSVTDSSNNSRGGILRVTDYTLQSGNTLTVNNVLLIFATNSITINGTIDADGAANNGGAGGSSNTDPGDNGGNSAITPRESGGSGGAGQDAAGNGGDGGDGDLRTYTINKRMQSSPLAVIEALETTNAVGAGGGGGGHPEENNEPAGNGNDGSAPGGGGGGSQSGSYESVSDGGEGGDGGGGVILVAPSITIGGTITADGKDGQDSASADITGGGGGGGSGGLIGIYTSNLTENSPTYSVSKGLGGTAATGNSYTGGDGADGRAGDIIKANTG